MATTYRALYSNISLQSEKCEEKSDSGDHLYDGESDSGDHLYDGDIYVVNPKDEHLATVVWLHSLGDNGSSWSSFLRTPERSQHIKWICPTAPLRNISSSYGSTTSSGFTAWFDSEDFSTEALVDEEDLNSSAKYVARLLAGEPPNIKLVVGGYGMGAATALHFAISVARGKFHNVKLSAVVAYSGWLPKTDWTSRLPAAGKGIELIQEITSSMHICLLYSKREDPIIPTKLSDEAFKWLSLCGFKNVECKRFEKLCNSEQYPYAEAAMGIVLTWLHDKLKPSKGGQPKSTVKVPLDVMDKTEISSETNPK